MLTFSLQNLNIYISQRNDGNFRRHQAIEHFFLNKRLANPNDQFIYLHLENKNQLVIFNKEQLSKNKTSQLLTGDAIISHWQTGDKEANKTLISMVLGDCFPLIFFDQKSKNMAMIHAGWEPLYLDILDSVWQTMLNLWQTTPAQIWAFLGPGIRAESYWVDKEPRQSQDPHWQKYIKNRQNYMKTQHSSIKTQAKNNKSWQIDLPAFIKKEFLERHNIPKQQLIDCQLDTYALSEEFFSYRRSQELLAKGEKKAAQAANGRFFVTCQLAN